MSLLRPAVVADVPRLAEIELEAGALFRTVGLDEVAEHDADLEELHAFVTAARAWVVEVDGTVAGYVTAEVLDGNAHVAQVSVSPAFGRQGFGRRLVAQVESWGRAAGLLATTLTTFRDVPFNGPYYARLGFRELAAGEIGPELAATMAREAALPGIDGTRRCAMVKSS